MPLLLFGVVVLHSCRLRFSGQNNGGGLARRSATRALSLASGDTAEATVLMTCEPIPEHDWSCLQRYVLGEIVLQDMSIRLSEAVWRDLTSSFFQWEGASAVRELVRKSREKRETSKRKEWTEDEMLVFLARPFYRWPRPRY